MTDNSRLMMVATSRESKARQSSPAYKRINVNLHTEYQSTFRALWQKRVRCSRGAGTCSFFFPQATLLISLATWLFLFIYYHFPHLSCHVTHFSCYFTALWASLATVLISHAMLLRNGHHLLLDSFLTLRCCVTGIIPPIRAMRCCFAWRIKI